MVRFTPFPLAARRKKNLFELFALLDYYKAVMEELTEQICVKCTNFS